MIVKFCFQNEIHRSSNPPQSYQDIPSFLSNMFKTELPQKFALQYITEDKEALPLTEEVYERLKAVSSAKPHKFVIVDESLVQEVKVEAPAVEKAAQADDFEVLDNLRQSEKKEEVLIEKPVESNVEQVAPVELKDIQVEMIEKLAADLTNTHIMPKFEGMAVDEAHVRNVVSETLKEMMPLIISHVKDSLHNQHGFNFAANPRGQSQPSRSYNVEFASHPVRENKTLFELQFEELKKQGKIFWNRAVDQISAIPDHLSAIPEQLSTIPDKVPGVVEKIKEFPSKIPGAIDTLNQQISGDPYVVCVEGRYPKSVVERGYQMKEIFSDEDTKGLLEFVSRMPREANLAQLADCFASYKQVREQNLKPASQENVPAPSQ